MIGVKGYVAGLGAMETRDTPSSYGDTKSVLPVSIMSFMKSIEGLGSRGYALNLSYREGLYYSWVTGAAIWPGKGVRGGVVRP
jgi:hypothetical protein